MNAVATWLIENWFLIIVIVALVVLVYTMIKRFTSLPSEEQVAKIKACLLNWVVLAEKELGSGTGKVKLSQVYGKFVEAFPFVALVVSFYTFSKWVDEALENMNNLLSNNKKLSEFVNTSTPKATEGSE